MNNVGTLDFQPNLFLFLGLVFTLYALFKKSTHQKLIENGHKVEGIVFELTQKPKIYIGKSDFNSDNTFPSVTVRFVTRKMEWITAEAKSDFVVYYTGQYKVGDKVNIIYNESNPNEFLILTKLSESAIKLLMALIGLVFVVIGALQILEFI